MEAVISEARGIAKERGITKLDAPQPLQAGGPI